MAVRNTQDITLKFNANNGDIIDVSGWDKVTWGFHTPSGTISITGTNDGGSNNPSPATAQNFTAIQATRLTDGTKVTSVTQNDLYEVDVNCQFVQFAGSGATAASVIVFFHKIH